MLLFGVYRHGFGNWQKIAGDKDLGLGGKIKTDENGEGVRPEQVEMRANQQLKRLREAAKGGKRGPRRGSEEKTKEEGGECRPRQEKAEARSGAKEQGRQI